MTINDALREDARLTYGNRWLVRSGDGFTVFEQKQGGRVERVVYDGADENEAVRVLMENCNC